MLMKLWPGDQNNQLERMNMKVYEDNVKATGMVNGWYQKVCRFTSNEFCKNIGCIVSARIFGIGGSSLWEKLKVKK